MATAAKHPSSGPNMTSPQLREQFTHLLMDCQNRMGACIYAILQNMSDTEEVFQQACLTMWEKFDTFSLGTDFAKWACSVSHRKAMQFLQDRRSKRVTFSSELLGELAGWEGDALEEPGERRLAALRGCMDRLPEKDRALVELRYVAKRKLAGVAEQFGRSRQSVGNSLARVRASLLACIERSLAREGS